MSREKLKQLLVLILMTGLMAVGLLVIWVSIPGLVASLNSIYSR